MLMCAKYFHDPVHVIHTCKGASISATSPPPQKMVICVIQLGMVTPVVYYRQVKGKANELPSPQESSGEDQSSHTHTLSHATHLTPHTTEGTQGPREMHMCRLDKKRREKTDSN